MCEQSKLPSVTNDNNRQIMQNLYFYHKNNILLRIIQSILTIYIGEGFFLFTEYNKLQYEIDEQLGYKIVFIPLCACLIGSLIFAIIPTCFITKIIKKTNNTNAQLNLRCFNIIILHLVVITHTAIGAILACLFSNTVGIENNYSFVLKVLIYSFLFGMIWGLMDYFSDMQISSDKFSNINDTNENNSNRKTYFYLYLITLLFSIICIIVLFAFTMLRFDSDILKQILYNAENSGETGAYIFIATQISLVIIYLKLAISRIHCDNNIFFDFCDL